MSHKSPASGTYVERRKFERAYFSSDDDVTGVIIVHDRVTPPINSNISHLSIGGDTSDFGMGGKITDLSIGGLYLIMKKDKALDLDVGSTLTLKEIQATVLYKLELDIEMQIRRIHNYEFVEHVGLGCEFTSINAKALEAIKRLVEWGLHSNGDDESCPP